MQSCLRLRLSEMWYALPVRYVVGVLSAIELLPLPHAPDYVRGTTIMRGQMVTVIDLRVMVENSLGVPLFRDTPMLVLRSRQGGVFVGIVDDVDNVIPASDTLEPVSGCSPFVAGVTYFQSSALPVLDIDALTEASVISQMP